MGIGMDDPHRAERIAQYVLTSVRVPVHRIREART